MTKIINPVFTATITTIIIAFLLASCSLGGKTKSSQFYVLDSTISPTEQETDNDVSLAISQVLVPGYIDRPQIITKTASAEIKFSEFNRWAEPIDSMFQRVLTQNIKTLTNSDQITSYPWAPEQTFEFTLRMKLIKFENNEAGDALLVANWILVKHNDESTPRANFSEFRASASNSSYAARVAALNDTLSQFSREIVNRMK